MKQTYEMIDEELKNLRLAPDNVLDIVSARIKEFNSKPSAELNDEYISSSVDLLSYVFFSLPFSVVDKKELWRARPSEYDEIFIHTDELKYPPEDKTTCQRANSHGSSVFYGASSPETSFAELRFKKGSYFHLTKYHIKPNEPVHLHMFGDLDNLRRSSKTIFEIPGYEDAYRYALKLLNPDVRLAVQLVDAFFVDRLSRKGNDDEYRVTSKIVEEILSHKSISGIIYPSVEHSGGFNYALRPSVYDNCIIPVEISIQRIIKDYGYGAYKAVNYQSTSISRCPGKITWPNKASFEQFSKFTEEQSKC